jgi:predicted GNAT superfamily acetyltransferase
VLCCEVNVRPRNDVSLEFHHTVGFREVGQQDTDGGKKTVSLLELPL